MKYLFTLFLAISFLTANSQSLKYETVKVGRWTLTYFPVAYLVKPHHVKTVNKSGRLAYYQEQNVNGMPNGLTVEMQDDLTNPYSVNYYYKGIAVYTATYFPNSSKANLITNINLKSEQEGPAIYRTMKDDNTVSEEKTVYKAGLDVKAKTNKPKILYNEDGLVNGYFEGDFREMSRYEKIKGRAVNGHIKYFEHRSSDSSGTSYEFNGGCVIYKQFNSKGEVVSENSGRTKRPIKLVKPDYEINVGDNVYPLRFDPEVFALIEQSLRPSFAEPKEKVSFSIWDNLLKGNFSSKFYCSVDIDGVANEGVIQEATVTYLETGAILKIQKEGSFYTIEKFDENRRLLKTLKIEITKPVVIVEDDSKIPSRLGNPERIVITPDFNPLTVIVKMTERLDEIKAFLK